MDIFLDSQLALHRDTVKLHENYIVLLTAMKKKLAENNETDMKAMLLAEKELNDASTAMEYDQDLIWNRIREAHPEAGPGGIHHRALAWRRSRGSDTRHGRTWRPSSSTRR